MAVQCLVIHLVNTMCYTTTLLVGTNQGRFEIKEPVDLDIRESGPCKCHECEGAFSINPYCARSGQSSLLMEAFLAKIITGVLLHPCICQWWAVSVWSTLCL